MQKAWYYAQEPNFGDLLNRNILSLFNQKIEYTASFDCDLIAIGSILQEFLKRMTIVRKIKKTFLKPIHVWGSGFITDHTQQGWTFRKRMIFHALRGRLSKAVCERMLGHKLANVCLGDPGLLASRLIDASKIRKKYTLAIVPHYVDKNNPLLAKIQIPGARILDVQQDPLEFLSQIAECENVVSSALHGLIAADSLGIPNMRMILSDKVKGNGYKFDDYYSAFGIANHSRINLNETDKFTELGLIKEKYEITPAMVEKICADLLCVFPYSRECHGNKANAFIRK